MGIIPVISTRHLDIRDWQCKDYFVTFHQNLLRHTRKNKQHCLLCLLTMSSLQTQCDKGAYLSRPCFLGVPSSLWLSGPNSTQRTTHESPGIPRLWQDSPASRFCGHFLRKSVPAMLNSSLSLFCSYQNICVYMYIPVEYSFLRLLIAIENYIYLIKCSNCKFLNFNALKILIS